MQLFKAFSTPSFLLADEGHPRLVYYLLETINSILYHQFNGMSPSSFLLPSFLSNSGHVLTLRHLVLEEAGSSWSRKPKFRLLGIEVTSGLPDFSDFHANVGIERYPEEESESSWYVLFSSHLSFA